MEERVKVEAVRVETPFGALESDSGNHLADVFTIMAILIILYLFKRMYIGK
mgnify:CR=1 FL=1|tara:strand:+ start:97 stop:249 length:153 start_codon:yes stop_codon:yes gene_type:complete